MLQKLTKCVIINLKKIKHYKQMYISHSVTLVMFVTFVNLNNNYTAITCNCQCFFVKFVNFVTFAQKRRRFL